MSQLILDLQAPGVTIRPIRAMTGEPHFCEMHFEDVFVPDDMLIGEAGQGWAQVMSELAYERSGPERFLSTYPLFAALVDELGSRPDARGAEVVGRLASHAAALHRMSLGVAERIDAGEAPAREAATAKELGTRFEREVTEAARSVVDAETASPRFAALLAEATLHGPGFTLRGGTNRDPAWHHRAWPGRAMNDVQRLLAETATQLFSRHATSGDVAPDPTSPGLPALARPRRYRPDARRGAGGARRRRWRPGRCCPGGRHRGPLRGAGAVGRDVPAGRLAARRGRPGLSARPAHGSYRRRRQGRGVPYARHAAGIAVLVERERGALIGLARPGQYRVEPADEHGRGARDTVTFDVLDDLRPAPPGIDAQTFRLRGALLRSIQMSGALRRVLDMTVAYATQRRQFGVAISRFQAVQQMLARWLARSRPRRRRSRRPWSGRPEPHRRCEVRPAMRLARSRRSRTR